MGTCKGCKYLEPMTDPSRFYCLMVEVGESPASIGVEAIEYGADAFVHTWLEVSPEFGCNQYEAKGEEANG